MGALGRERTFLLRPKEGAAEFRLPSDLLGLTTIYYNATAAEGSNPSKPTGRPELSKTLTKLRLKPTSKSNVSPGREAREQSV